jgi:hypothetical protein
MTIQDTTNERAGSEPHLAPVQRARLLDRTGEEIAAGLARLELSNPAGAVLVDLEPVALLMRSLAQGRRDYHLELEEGPTLGVRIIRTSGTVGRRRICFLRVLASTLTRYAIGEEWHEIRA